jgi:hypothetical protein
VSRWSQRRRDGNGVVHVSDTTHWACGGCCDKSWTGVLVGDAAAVNCIQCLVHLVREAPSVELRPVTWPVRADQLNLGVCCDCGSSLHEGPDMCYRCPEINCGSTFCYSLSWERTSPPRPNQGRHK